MVYDQTHHNPAPEDVDAGAGLDGNGLDITTKEKALTSTLTRTALPSARTARSQKYAPEYDWRYILCLNKHK